jgi:hypothetical protein
MNDCRIYCPELDTFENTGWCYSNYIDTVTIIWDWLRQTKMYGPHDILPVLPLVTWLSASSEHVHTGSTPHHSCASYPFCSSYVPFSLSAEFIVLYTNPQWIICPGNLHTGAAHDSPEESQYPAQCLAQRRCPMVIYWNLFWISPSFFFLNTFWRGRKWRKKMLGRQEEGGNVRIEKNT